MSDLPGYDAWKTTPPESDGYPMVDCPKCGKLYEDMDGFGFIACLPNGCGYCTHPAKDLIEGDWICGICGQADPRNDGH